MRRIAITIATAAVAASGLLGLTLGTTSPAHAAPVSMTAHLESLGATAKEAAVLERAGQAANVKSVSQALIAPSSMVTTASYFGPTGVCASGINYCWSQKGGFTGSSPTYLWGRDINGNAAQEYGVVYEGQSPVNGNCGQYSNVGVFAFIDNNGNGYLISGAYYSNGKYYVGEGSGSTSWWVWQNNGVIQNCGENAQNYHYWAMSETTSYQPIVTVATGFGTGWMQVHV